MWILLKLFDFTLAIIKNTVHMLTAALVQVFKNR